MTLSFKMSSRRTKQNIKNTANITNLGRPSSTKSTGIMLHDYGDLENVLPTNVLTMKEPHFNAPPTSAVSKISSVVFSKSVSSEVSEECVGDAENTPMNEQNIPMNEQSEYSKRDVRVRRSGPPGSILKPILSKPSTSVTLKEPDVTVENSPMNKQSNDSKMYVRSRRLNSAGRNLKLTLNRPSTLVTTKVSSDHDIKNMLINELSISTINLRSRSKLSTSETTDLHGERSYEESHEEENSEPQPISEIPTEENEDISKCYDYGEPLRYQHLRFDFTPIQGVDDDEELFQKCAAFWNFVDSRPEFREILVKPIKVAGDTSSFINSDSDLEEIKLNTEAGQVPQVKPGMQWTADLPLEYLGKLSLQYCAEPPPEYKYSSDKTSETSGRSASKFWMKSKKDNLVKQTYDEEQTKKLNAEMEEFDQKHPRYFDSPRTLTRSLITAEMQKLLPVYSD